VIGSSFLDPVLGVDIHWELVPTPAPVPTPIPNPFTGIIFDPIGLAVGLAIGGAMSAVFGASFQGPVLYWTAFPATNTGTEAKHVPGHILIPPGVSWAPVPKTPKPVIHPGETPSPPKPVIPDNDAVVITGSKTVHVMGSNAARLGDLLLSCSEPVRLPSSVILAVPKGAPILIGGPPALDLLQAILASLRTRFISDSIHALISRMSPSRFRNFLNRAVCFLTGHPVDVATGRVLTDAVDFTFDGPLPLRFARTYSSGFAARDGALGHGWSHSLDQSITVERGCVVWRTDDGRELEFDTFDLPEHRMVAGDTLRLPYERATLRCLGADRWEIVRGDGVRLTFEPVGRLDGRAMLRAMRSAGGHHTNTFEYDTLGNLQRATDAQGREVRFTHDLHGRLVRVELPDPARPGGYTHRVFRYDGDGDLVEVIDSLGAAWRFEYATHLLVRETDRNGLSFYFQYDGIGQDAWCVRTWGDGGLYDHVLGYDKRKRVTWVTDSRGATTQYHMNGAGLVVKLVDPFGGETVLDYDPVTLSRVKLTDPTGAWVARELDLLGRVTATRDAAGAASAITYAGDHPAEVVDQDGARWQLGFTVEGYPTFAVAPTGDTWRWDWARDLLTRAVSPGPSDIAWVYDDRGAIGAERYGNGAEQRYEHDRWGRTTRITTPRGGVVERRWDTEGRLVELRSPTGVTQRFEHDAEGNITRAADGVRAVGFRHGLLRRVLARTEAGATTRFEYDTEGRLTAVVRPSGARATFTWDACGRLSRETDFDGAVREYKRDKAGRVLREKSPSGARAYRYDVMGRMVGVEHGDGAKLELERRADGFITRALRDDVAVEFTRDALGRVLSERQGEVEVRSWYAAHGQREVLESSLGARSVVWRDGLGDVLAVGFGHPGDITGAHLSYERDGMGFESVRRVFGGVTTATERDVSGRVVTTSTALADGRSLDAASYAWRGDDQIAAAIDPMRGARRYDHDEAGRLVRELGPEGALPRAFDDDDNVYRDEARAGRRYTATGAMVASEQGRFEYDASGRRTRWTDLDGGEWRYRWDGFGLLREVHRPDGRRVRFDYDAFARRTSKRLVDVSPDGVEAVARETRYVWDGDTVLHELSPEAMTTWHWDADARKPLARERDGVWCSVSHDPVGTPTELRDTTGALAWKMQLDAWGVGRFEEGAADDCPWRRPGQYHDSETGLYYNRFRYFDPEAGAYLSPDPMRTFVGSPYGYVREPNVWTDPDGLIAMHHTIPKRLTESMQGRGMLGSGHNQTAFASTTRSGLAPLADTAGSHTHSQAHAALSHYLDPHGTLGLPNGTQRGAHWDAYLNHVQSQGHGGQHVLDQFHNFYHTWLPQQVAAGHYPLISAADVTAMQHAFDHDKNNLSPHCQ
jgi:RHS repeat-associated protein